METVNYNTNEVLAQNFGEFSCCEYESEVSSYPECYDSALKMADLKDQVIKQFFIEHMCPDVEVETNEDGQPLAESYIKAQTRRFKLGEEMFNRFKEFEKRYL